MMIGGDLPHPHHREARTRGDGGLVVDALSLPADDPFGTDLVDVDLAVRGGEIVGIAGVSGNGQNELMAALSGERTLERADAIVLNGEPVGAARRRARGARSDSPSCPRSGWDVARFPRCRSPTTRCSPRIARALRGAASFAPTR